MEDISVKYNEEKYINRNINQKLNNENDPVYSKQVLNKFSSKGAYEVYNDEIPATLHGINNYQKKQHLLYNEKHNLIKDHNEGTRHSYSVNVGKLYDDHNMNKIMKTGQQQKSYQQMNNNNKNNPNMILNDNTKSKNNVNSNKNSRYDT